MNDKEIKSVLKEVDKLLKRLEKKGQQPSKREMDLLEEIADEIELKRGKMKQERDQSLVDKLEDLVEYSSKSEEISQTTANSIVEAINRIKLVVPSPTVSVEPPRVNVTVPEVKIPQIKVPEVRVPDTINVSRPAWIDGIINLLPITSLLESIRESIPSLRLPTGSKEPISVRLSDGEKFYRALGGSGGAASIPTYKNSAGEAKQGLVDEDGHVQVDITASDSASVDAFGRWRVSNPYTLWDSKQIYDDADISNNEENSQLFYSNVEASGTGTSTTFNPNRSSTTIAVSANKTGTRVRQSKRRFNYQSGKSLLIFMTFVMNDPVANITKREGYFDEKNGIFLEFSGTSVRFVRRTFSSGVPVDNAVEQSDWSEDTMDGNGSSGITLDWTKTQILVIDMEWLGVGRVRAGFVVDGKIYYAHHFLNTNVLPVVYMQSPNLPIRSEIGNNGLGIASEMEQICSTVISEGGSEDTGAVMSASNGNTHVDANVAGTNYACIGLKLKSTHLGATVKTVSMSMMGSTTNDNFHWQLLLNPTVAGTFTYSNISNSACMVAKGATANVVTGGTLLNSGYAASNTAISGELINSLSLGASVSGESDSIVLCVTPIGAASNLDIYSSITWRELL